MKLLIKLGGTLLDAPETRLALAAELAATCRTHQTVVVHGGGKQMTRYLSDHGVESKFVNGLRVTGPEVIDAVLKVLAGTVNHELVASLVSVGAMAVGLSGIDACLTEAEQMDPQLGSVGRPVRANGALLDILTSNGYLPVVACVAGDRSGRIYNVNADQMAVACASAFHTDRLLFLTDVDGVRGAEGTNLPLLTASEARQLIETGVATGGMQAKLAAAEQALVQGVGQVVIAPGAAPGIIGRLLANEEVGTRIVRAEGGRT